MPSMAEGPNTQDDRRRTLLACAKFSVEERLVVGADGVERARQVIRHPGAVVILPILESGLVFVRNKRVAVDAELLELPAGTLEPGEDPVACARRELEEETGYSCATIEPLCRFYTTPGMTDELMWAYAASGLREVGQRLEADEEIRVEVLSPHEAIRAIENGELRDGKSMLTLLEALRRGMIAVEPGGA